MKPLDVGTTILAEARDEGMYEDLKRILLRFSGQPVGYFFGDECLDGEYKPGPHDISGYLFRSIERLRVIPPKYYRVVRDKKRIAQAKEELTDRMAVENDWGWSLEDDRTILVMMSRQ